MSLKSRGSITVRTLKFWKKEDDFKAVGMTDVVTGIFSNIKYT